MLPLLLTLLLQILTLTRPLPAHNRAPRLCTAHCLIDWAAFPGSAHLRRLLNLPMRLPLAVTWAMLLPLPFRLPWLLLQLHLLLLHLLLLLQLLRRWQ